MDMESCIIQIKRGDTPFYAYLRRIGKAILSFQISYPRAFHPVFRFIQYIHRLNFEIDERIRVACFRAPLLRACCASAGERLRMELVPNISGSVKIYLGDDVHLSGSSSIVGGRVFSDPELRIGNRTFIGHGCSFSIAKSIFIGDDVLIAGRCTLSDYSGHPVNPERRAANVQVDPEEVRPVRIENKVWLGKGVVVLPGVTIGEGAVVGAATVVTKDVPAGCICVGNPGRLLQRSVYEARRDRVASRVQAGDYSI